MSDDQEHNAEVDIELHKIKYQHELSLIKAKYEYDLRAVEEENKSERDFYNKHKELLISGIKDIGLSYARSCMIINAGTIIAILGFIGQIAGRDISSFARATQAFSTSMKLFLIGVVLSVSSSGLSYLQSFSVGDNEEDIEKERSRFHNAARKLLWFALRAFTILAGALALATFLAGGWMAANTVHLLGT